MEGEKIFENKNLPTNNDRNEKIEEAQNRIAKIFENRMSEILKRIGENPYFSDLEGRI